MTLWLAWKEHQRKKVLDKGTKDILQFFMQELRRPRQTVSDPTTINVTECPHVIMQISNDKLLIRRLHWVILGVENMGMSWSWKKIINYAKSKSDKSLVPTAETTSLQLSVALRNHHVYLYHLRLNFCRNIQWDACFWYKHQELELGRRQFPGMVSRIKRFISFWISRNAISHIYRCFLKAAHVTTVLSVGSY